MKSGAATGQRLLQHLYIALGRRAPSPAAVREERRRSAAVAMVVTDAEAGRATSALDAVVEWIATHG